MYHLWCHRLLKHKWTKRDLTTSKFYWEMQSKRKIHNTDWWIWMDIPLAIPRSKKLTPNLFLQERSLDKSHKKVGGLWREVKGMDRKKKQTNKNPHGGIFCSRKKSIIVSLEFTCSLGQFGFFLSKHCPKLVWMVSNPVSFQAKSSDANGFSLWASELITY